MDVLSLLIGNLQDTAGAVLIRRPGLHVILSRVSEHPDGVSQELCCRKILVSNDTHTYPVHGWHHSREVLVRDDYGEVGLAEDVVPLLASAFHTIVQVVPGPGHRTVYLVDLRLSLPLGPHVGEEVRAVDGLVDGDVSEPALQSTALLVVHEGAPDSLEVLPVAHLIKLSLLEVAKVAGELFSLPLVVYQPSILIGEVLLPSEASDLPTSAFQQILKGRLWLYPSRSAH